ncbi:hypothetical protein PIB30_075840 [Stylosanthes scabra]|uniref:Uncharacterized protein n=1 Tax=Stylosanthes scabra TaxID=79078 RepID=A0ABU6ZNN9_9FABA|nr:hypothetical protein [Stylosanthes scabra]
MSPFQNGHSGSDNTNPICGYSTNPTQFARIGLPILPVTEWIEDVADLLVGRVSIEAAVKISLLQPSPHLRVALSQPSRHHRLLSHGGLFNRNP